MVLLDLILSQSVTETSASTSAQSIFQIQLPHDIHLRKGSRIRLVGYTMIKADASEVWKVLNVHIPWLDAASSHLIGSSSNIDNNSGTNVNYKYDIRRQHEKSLILTTTKTENHVHGLNLELDLNADKIPRLFNVTLKNAIDDSPYTNLLFGVLKFSIY